MQSFLGAMPMVKEKTIAGSGGASDKRPNRHIREPWPS
jgi:hypothetical protein